MQRTSDLPITVAEAKSLGVSLADYVRALRDQIARRTPAHGEEGK